MIVLEPYFPNRTFAALLFDFDGTVADTMGTHFDAWNKALAPHGIKFAKEQHLAWAGQPTRQILKTLSDLHGVQISADEFGRAKEAHYLASLATVMEIRVIVELIKKFHGQVPMAVVSGSRRRPVETTLKHLGLTHYFTTLVCAEDYTHGKPDPECFLTAAQSLKVEPSTCLVFEDATLGIQAAQRAGMACLRIVEAEDAGHRIEVV